VELTVHRPIGLSTLLRRSNEWALAARNDIVNLVGRHFFLSKSALTDPGLSKLKLKEVTSLTIKPGAYVSRPTDVRQMIPWRPRRLQVSQWDLPAVCIEDPVDTEGIRDTLSIIFDHSEGGEAIESDSQEWRSMILLRCSASVLVLITEAVSRDLAPLINMC
jgi:hypothetical protein